MIAGIAVLWAGYTLAWWGWLGMTNQVPKGRPGEIWWPSIMDLVVPGKAANLSNTVRVQNKLQQASTGALADIGNGNLNDVPPGMVKGPTGSA
jgi:hypothetical protein